MHTEEEVWSGGTLPMLLPESKLWIHTKFKVCSTKELFGQSLFLAFFFVHDMNT